MYQKIAPLFDTYAMYMKKWVTIFGVLIKKLPLMSDYNFGEIGFSSCHIKVD